MFKLSTMYDRVINLYAHTKTGYNRPSLASSFISIKKYEPMFSVAADKSSVNEGTAVRFDVNAFNVKNGTVVYYAITGCSASDFVDGNLTGSCVITGGSGYFTKTLVADAATEGVENLQVGLKTSANGRVIKYAPLVTVADTSLTPVPVYSVIATPDSTNESGSVSFNWSVVNSVGAALTWEITGVSVGDFTDVLGLSGSLSGTSGSVTKVLSQDQLTEGLETITFNFKAAGSSVATCTCAITDSSLTPFYSLSSNPTSTNESGTVVFSYSSSNVPVGTVLSWGITGVSSTDFTDGLSLSGSLTINTSGTITKVLAADVLTEGSETITFTLIANGSSKVSTTCTVADSSAVLLVNEVFKTYLYTGNGSTQTINNGIDLATKGGMVWTKARNISDDPRIHDTVTGITKRLATNTTGLLSSNSDITGALVNGFNLGWVAGDANTNTNTYVSWTFRKAPKFFDVVSYTGDGAGNRAIAHSLGVAPGLVITKSTSAAGQWVCYARTGTTSWVIPNSGGTSTFGLSQTNGGYSFADASPYFTSTIFSPSALGYTADSNASGVTYVAYLFAQDPTGFIQCASFTTDASGNGAISHGWSAGVQYIMLKCADATGDWEIYDTVRTPSFSGNDARLRANLANAEDSVARVSPSGTTLQLTGLLASKNYIYMVIKSA